MILINASNLHVGGGVQVACSFFDELSNVDLLDLDISIWVSSEVHSALLSIHSPICNFPRYEIHNVYGVSAFFSRLNKRIPSFDIVFTIFGPNYFFNKARVEIAGFAQLWIVSINNPILRKMPFFRRIITRFKFYVQWLFFARSNHLIVELDHVKDSLCSVRQCRPCDVSVVYNAVSALYFDSEKWRPVKLPDHDCDFSLGIVSRDYPHKNLDILPLVAEILESKYNFKVKFYVTLNDDEWSLKDEFFKKYVLTVGALSPDQCPSFYEQVDAVVFPSLMECFSATPIEAMVMSKPLFASDRRFVRDVCGDFAVYFDPLNHYDIADKIYNYYKETIDHSVFLRDARAHALTFSSSRKRAEEYLNIIKKFTKG